MLTTATYIIAEAGVNHNGSEELAFKLIDAAANAGADAIKFQTFKPESLVSKYAQKANYQKDTTGSEETQLSLLKSLALSHDTFIELKKYCELRKIDFLSSAFDIESARFLIDILDVDTIKLGSGELNNAPLLYEISRSGVKVILSTGMAMLGEIEEALGVLLYGYLGGDSPTEAAFKASYFSNKAQNILAEKVTLLHCTTAYPADPGSLNLRALTTLSSAFPVSVGYSDHSLGIGVSLGAVALGAEVIEKHFTLDKTLAGPDHRASLSILELRNMVSEIRQLDIALGVSYKHPSKEELENAKVVRKSLIAKSNIQKGEKFTIHNLTTKRPGYGISPIKYWDYLSKKSEKNLEIDEVITK